MKIAQVMYGIGNGGADIMALSLITKLVETGNYVDIISIDEPYENDILQTKALDHIKSLKITHYCLFRKPKTFGLSSFLKFKHILKKENYDIVHSHLLVPDIYCGLAKTISPRSKFKHVITVHNTVLYHSKALLKTIFRNSTFVKCSPAIKDLGSVRKEYAIPNGVNLNKFLPDIKNKFDLKSHLKIADNSILIISVGNLRKQKNQRISVETIYELKHTYDLKNIHLLFVGRGPEYEDLKNYAQELNVLERIHFLGLRNDVPQLLYNSDIFISTSLWEGLPLAVIEAFASGITTVISPLYEHITIGENMFECYFPSEVSGESFANTMNEVICKIKNSDHHTIWQKRKKEMNIYSIETFSKSYINLYKSLRDRS